MLKAKVGNTWDALMSIDRNPLRHMPLSTAHFLMQVLAWMWSIIFSFAVGSYLVFGLTALAHSLVLAGVFVTFAVFQVARKSKPAA